MSGLVLPQKFTITLASFCARNDYEREHVAVRWIAGVEFQIYKHGATSLIVNFRQVKFERCTNEAHTAVCTVGTRTNYLDPM